MHKTMLLPIFVLMLLVSSGSRAADLQKVATIMLNQPSEVADAKRLNDAIDAMSLKVNECVKNNTTKPDECHCLYPKEKSNLEEIYRTTLRKHPGWRDKVIFWQREDSYSYNLSLEGLSRSLQLTCPTHPSSGTLR